MTIMCVTHCYNFNSLSHSINHSILAVIRLWYITVVNAINLHLYIVYFVLMLMLINILYYICNDVDMISYMTVYK